MNDVATQGTNGALTTTERNPFERYGDSAANRGGIMLKFKDGEFLLGASEELVALETLVLMRIDEMQIGWLRWTNNMPTDRVFGKLMDDFQPPRRAELGGLDKTEWEVDAAGIPRDPWQFSNELPVLIDGDDTGDEATYSASSKGAIAALAEVAKAYGPRMRQHPDELPVVRIGADSYENKKWNRKVRIPVFEVVDWMTLDEWAAGVVAEAPAAVPAPVPEPVAAPKKRRRGRPAKAAQTPEQAVGQAVTDAAQAKGAEQEENFDI